MSINDANRPLRVFDKVLNGGLGAGNIGVVMSRHGTGKAAVLATIAIDHAMDGVNTLHVVFGKDVHDVRAYDDEVLDRMLEAYDLKDHARIMTTVERHKQIYTYRDGDFSAERLRGTLVLLAEHAQFKPGMIDIQGWPDYESVSEEEIKALKSIAVEFECEVWVTAHTHRTDADDVYAVPDFIQRFDTHHSVLLALDPVGQHVHIRFIKTHDSTPQEGVNLEFDPKTMLIRWR